LNAPYQYDPVHGDPAGGWDDNADAWAHQEELLKLRDAEYWRRVRLEAVQEEVQRLKDAAFDEQLAKDWEAFEATLTAFEKELPK
jgi:hypothetical protein